MVRTDEINFVKNIDDLPSEEYITQHKPSA